ncbi:hypothetical protein BHE74_00027685 [Ensete ventricosum]|nr:hypothetical protein BHE74_00027685 [Ensete ventricosum]
MTLFTIALAVGLISPARCHGRGIQLLYLKGDLGLVGFARVFLHSGPCVPMANELLYPIMEAVTIFRVMAVIPVESTVLHSVLQLFGTLQRVDHP